MSEFPRCDTGSTKNEPFVVTTTSRLTLRSFLRKEATKAGRTESNQLLLDELMTKAFASSG
jgi:hypothetical protein